jgi:structural maintenance of chromosome 4
VKAAAAVAVTDLALQEKEEAGLEERRKYAGAQAKKLKKALQDDGKGKKDAERVLEESAAKIKRERASVKKLEGELRTEEAALEEITNSLKGTARPLRTRQS